MLLAVLMTARMRPSLATTSLLPTRRRQELRTRRADKYIDWKLGEYTLAGLSPQRNLSIVFLSRERRHSPAQRWCNSPPALASWLFAIQISLQERQPLPMALTKPEVYKSRECEVFLKGFKSLLRRSVRQLSQSRQCLQVIYHHC